MSFGKEEEQAVFARFFLSEFRKDDENAEEWAKNASCLILTESRDNKFQIQKRISSEGHASMTDEQRTWKKISAYLILDARVMFAEQLKSEDLGKGYIFVSQRRTTQSGQRAWFRNY